MRRLTHDEFVAKARAVHGDTYVYEAPYQSTGALLAITCKKHGVFTQTPNAHISQKQGCPTCGKEQVGLKSRHSLDTIIQQFQNVHGNTYDYSLVQYKGAHKPVTIICQVHGAFTQTPHSHKKGQGCAACSRKKQQAYNTRRNELITSNFVGLARSKHGDTFDYTLTDYTHNQGKITFRCRVHDKILTQTARDHLDGYNPCPSCNHMKSHKEQEVADFLSIFTKTECRNRSLLAPKELDIYLPEKQLAVEFCGDYWHSHGDAESELKDRNKHITKHKLAAEQGVRLITIWGSEWDERQFAVKRLLRCAVGKLKGKLMARKCELRTVPHSEAVAFYDRYHPQGGVGQGLHYGLYWKGKLVACMRFTKGANDRGNARSRDWTLTRYATRVTVAGGASRLFKAFIREHNPKKVKSFSDNRFFSGGMYKQLGFVLEAEGKADYTVWHQKLGVLPKSAWQRRSIPARAKELGLEIDFDPVSSPETERDMTFMLGARRLYDCGKKRWVWTT